MTKEELLALGVTEEQAKKSWRTRKRILFLFRNSTK